MSVGEFKSAVYDRIDYAQLAGKMHADEFDHDLLARAYIARCHRLKPDPKAYQLA